MFIAEIREAYDKDIGIFYDARGAPHLDPKAFAQYTAQRWAIRYYQENFYVYCHGLWTHWPDDKLKTFLFNHIEKINDQVFSLAVEKKYLEFLKRLCYSEKGFNSNRNYINLQNGILKLEDLTLHKHTPKLRSTIQLPFSYDPKAQCPRFMRFLQDLFLGDKEVVDVVQEVMGYCLSADVEAQRFFIFHGEGSNGKSVFCDILRCLIGEGNCSALSIKELGQRFSIADLDGKLVNISTENEEDANRTYDSQHIKAITGGDVLKAERKHRDVFSFKPVCKLVFAVNNLPVFHDASYGFYRRIMVIPFKATFRKEDGTADVHLFNKLKAELPGIFNFALEGLMRLRKNDYMFSSSEKIEKCSREYGDSYDPYAEFINNTLELTDSQSDTVERTVVYQTFIKWAQDNNQNQLCDISPQKFWSEVKRVFYQKHSNLDKRKINGIYHVVGVKIKN